MSNQGRMSELDKILNDKPTGKTSKVEAKGAETPGVAADDIVELPEPGSDYKAYSNCANKPVYTLHCLLGKEGIVSFQYVNLDSHSEFHPSEHGQVITIRFSGTKIWQVTITGTGLRKLYDGIHRHVIAWVRKSDRGFAAGPKGDALVMGIEIKDVTPKE